MAYKTATKESDLVRRYVEEWKSWREDLRQYWPSIDKNQEMYEFYKRESSESEAEVALNTPFTIVEALVAKVNESSLRVTVRAKGENDLGEFESYIATLLKDAIEDPDVADIVGTFRKKKEEFAREFFVKGNAVAEVSWLYKTVVAAEGEKRVVADNPYVTVIPLKRYIFNPSQGFAQSRVKYIEKYVTWQEIKDKEYDPKTGRGLYKNLAELKKIVGDDDKLSDDDEEQLIAGDRKVAKRKPAVHLLERWEEAKLCVIANQKVLIREDYDPMKIGGSPILTATNYSVVGRPYAYGEIDAIYKPVRAQDTVINQAIMAVNRYLRPAYFVKDASADLDAYIDVLEMGGVTFGDPASIAPPAVVPPPQQAFQSIDTLQQAIERAARFSPYATGVPSQQTDRTQGTLGGIVRLQMAAEPNFQIKLDNLQDSFVRPLARMYLQMIASLMGEHEVRYGLLRDKSPQWVKATRGILLGRATVRDLLQVGMISEKDLLDENGQPIPELLGAVIFDVDWIVDVRLDNQARADRIAEGQLRMELIDWARNLGVQFNPERTATKIAASFDETEMESLYLTPEEKQAQRAAIIEQQRAERQAKLAEQEMSARTELAKENMRAMSQIEKERLRHIPAGLA